MMGEDPYPMLGLHGLLMRAIQSAGMKSTGNMIPENGLRVPHKPSIPPPQVPGQILRFFMMKAKTQYIIK
jgi:hypothetical protein